MSATATQEKLGPPRFAIAALLIANALLALGPWLVRVADTGPVASAFWRMAIALPLIMLMAAASKEKRAVFTPTLVIIIMVSGVLFAGDLAAWHLGIMRTKAANASLFGNSASFILPVYGFIAASAWPTRRQGRALVMALAGATLLMGRSAELSPQYLIGDLLSFLAGVLYAAYFIVLIRARVALAPLPLLAATTAASAPPLLLFALLLGERIVPVDWTPLIALALFSQVIGQGLLTYVLGRVSPLVLGLALLTQPVVSATAGWLAFGETLGALDLAGAALVALALLLVREPERAP
jgi:drug/metabolite transporter (DMT)-like permease